MKHCSICHIELNQDWRNTCYACDLIQMDGYIHKYDVNEDYLYKEKE